MTSATIQEYNKRQVFNTVYESVKVSRQDVVTRLRLSLPTVTQCLKELEEANLIEKNGFFQSTGGRKSIAYSFVDNARVAIGSQISKHSVRLVAIDLYGNVFKRKKIPLPFVNRVEYYKSFGKHIRDFIQSLNIAEKRVLGIGIATKGLVSNDHSVVTQGVLLNNAGVKQTDFAAWIDHPCRMVHDSKAAATTELWFSTDISDALFVSLDYDLGGALIMDRDIHRGKENHAGLIEHYTLVPGGRLCSCGNRGCLSSYCSGRVLLREDEIDFEDYFERLRAGDTEAAALWDDYTQNLIIAIGSLHMVLDCDIILGGRVAAFLSGSDVLRIQQAIREQSVFAAVSDFVRLGHQDIDVTACGSALPFIRDFLEKIG